MRPFCEALPFDLALYFESKFYRIQVKRAQKYKKTGRWEIPFRKTTVNSKGTKTKRYSEKDIEFIIGVVVETGDLYCFPMNKSRGVKAVIQVDPNGVSRCKGWNRSIDPEMFRNRIKLGKVEIAI